MCDQVVGGDGSNVQTEGSFPLVPDSHYKNAVPPLQAISIDGSQRLGEVTDEDDQQILDFCARMHSLEVFRFERKVLQGETVADCSIFLGSCPNLTHFHISGVAMALPTDPLCYAKMKQMVLDDPYHLIIHEELAKALVIPTN